MKHALALAAFALLAAPLPADAQPADAPAPAATPAPADSVATAPADWPVYKTVGFSIAHPADFAVDPHHEYEGLGEGRAILGTAFKVPDSFTSGTNLSPDSYLSVEIFPAITCTPHAFLLNPTDQPDVKQGDRTWLVATDGEGAAGSIYEDTVYALKDSVPCIGVRYFVHATEIGNYDPGTVQAYDAARLNGIFDKMRNSLTPESKPQANP